MASTRNKVKYVINLHKGEMAHRLTLSYSQKARLLTAWNNRDTNFRLVFDNGYVFQIDLTKFEILTYAPLPQSK